MVAVAAAAVSRAQPPLAHRTGRGEVRPPARSDAPAGAHTASRTAMARSGASCSGPSTTGGGGLFVPPVFRFLMGRKGPKALPPTR